MAQNHHDHNSTNHDHNHGHEPPKKPGRSGKSNRQCAVIHIYLNAYFYAGAHVIYYSKWVFYC